MNDTSSCIGEAIDEVNTLIGQRDFTGLDNRLSGMKVSSVDTPVLIAFARASAPVRIKLPSWHAFVARCAGIINARGKDANLVLKGLL